MSFDLDDLGDDTLRECPACAGVCAPLGTLGRTTHYRGIEWSESPAPASLRGDNLVAEVA